MPKEQRPLMQIRASNEEKAAIMKQAKKEHFLSYSEFVRKIVLDYIEKQNH